LGDNPLPAPADIYFPTLYATNIFIFTNLIGFTGPA